MIVVIELSLFLKQLKIGNETMPFFQEFPEIPLLELRPEKIVGTFDLDFRSSELAIPVIQGLDTRVPWYRRECTEVYRGRSESECLSWLGPALASPPLDARSRVVTKPLPPEETTQNLMWETAVFVGTNQLWQTSP
jgi:hypothetical protein